MKQVLRHSWVNTKTLTVPLTVVHWPLFHAPLSLEYGFVLPSSEPPVEQHVRMDEPRGDAGGVHSLSPYLAGGNQEHTRAHAGCY